MVSQEANHDLGLWSLLISILALALTLPLGLVGTLLAPKVQDWWAQRSKRSLAERVQRLGDKLKLLEIDGPLTANELKIVRTLEDLAFLVGSMIVFLVLLSYQATRLPFTMYPPPPLNALRTFVITLVLGLVVTSFIFRLRSWRLERTPGYREKLKAKIENLNGKISSKT